MLESIVKDVIMSHCNDSEIFADARYGFRPRRGCFIQLLKVFDDRSRYIESDIPVDTFFFIRHLTVSLIKDC